MKTRILSTCSTFNYTFGAVASKSYAQRALISAMLCSHMDQSVVTFGGRVSDMCADTRDVLKVIERLGAEVTMREIGPVTEIVIRGAMPFGDGFPSEVNVGESGFAARVLGVVLVAAVSCGLSQEQFAHRDKVAFRLTGSGTLVGRDMRALASVLEQMGAECRSTSISDSDGVRSDVCLPLDIVCRPLSYSPDKAATFNVDGGVGSQVVSGVLMAEPFLRLSSQAGVEIVVHSLVSKPYVEMTRGVLAHFGVTSSSLATLATASMSNLSPDSMYRGAEYFVPGDWSSAALMLVAGAVLGSVEVKGLSVDSRQGDSDIVDVLRLAGAEVAVDVSGRSVSAARIISTMTCGNLELLAFEWDATDSPDMFVALAVLAAFATGGSGVSVIRGLGRLSGKESDRGSSIIEVLAAFGVESYVNIMLDSMVIRGRSVESFAVTSDFMQGEDAVIVIDPHSDHRIAMMSAVMALAVRGVAVEILDAQCVDKSYAGFWNDFSRLANVEFID